MKNSALEIADAPGTFAQELSKDFQLKKLSNLLGRESGYFGSKVGYGL